LVMTLKFGFVVACVGTALLWGGCVQPHQHPREPRPVHLRGSVHGSTYTSAEGGFTVPFPVSPEVRGRVMSDDAQGVSFGDDWGSRIIFYGETILPHSPMMGMLQQDGREKALTAYARHAYGDMIGVHYHPEAREGTISFVCLRPASRKTGVAIFMHDKRLFLVETDTLPGEALLAQNDQKSQIERDAMLEERAVALAQTMDTK
jgi:hypothetical protein